MPNITDYLKSVNLRDEWSDQVKTLIYDIGAYDFI